MAWPTRCSRRWLSRHTPKKPFDTARPVAADTLQRLLASVPAGGPVRADGTVEMARVQTLRQLCMDAARVELTTPRTVMESVRLTRVGPDEILTHRDGISINTRVPRIAAALGQFDRGAPPAEGSPAQKQALQMFEGYSLTAMGFVWLSTARNGRADQIDAGRAYVRQQLHATALGVGLHPMSQALQEFPEMAPHYRTVHRLLIGTDAPRGVDEPTVQMMCRVGYSAQRVPATPRRPLAQFMARCCNSMTNVSSAWMHRGGPHRRAVALEAPSLGAHLAVHLPAEPHRADRLVGRAAARARHAGDGHRHLRRRARHRAFGHGARHRLADRALAVDECRVDAQQLGLGRIRIGDEAALEPVAGARQVGAGAGDQAAGAAFGGGHHPTLFLKQIGHQRNEGGRTVL